MVLALLACVCTHSSTNKQNNTKNNQTLPPPQQKKQKNKNKTETKALPQINVLHSVKAL